MTFLGEQPFAVSPKELDHMAAKGFSAGLCSTSRELTPTLDYRVMLI